MQKLRFHHPVRSTVLECEMPIQMTVREILEKLILDGFISQKKGGYQLIIDDRLCNLSSPLEDYLPYPVPEVVDVRVHGLLIVLT